MTMYDVIVIGGSYAGMAAAPQSARGHYRVLVIDSDTRRNGHGLCPDGKLPTQMVSEAKAQLLKYPWKRQLLPRITTIPVIEPNDGRILESAGLFVASHTRPASLL